MSNILVKEITVAVAFLL